MGSAMVGAGKELPLLSRGFGCNPEKIYLNFGTFLNFKNLRTVEDNANVATTSKGFIRL